MRVVLVLDPGKDSGPLSTNIRVPILILESDAWSSQQTLFFGANHFGVVKSIAETSLNALGAGWFLTLLGTAHTSITDAGLIAGSTLLSYSTVVLLQYWTRLRFSKNKSTCLRNS